MPDEHRAMVAPAFIGVDWGTTNSRFSLASAAGDLLDERTGPGIASLDCPDAIESALFTAICDWPGLPVVISGMAGSDIGWRPAPYVCVPANAQSVHAASVRFTVRNVSIALLPGVRILRSDGHPDVMRGEETQIFGGISIDTGLICLPGTHSKWANVKSGRIERFHTAMSGELMDVIGRSTILLSPKRPPLARPSTQFVEGVKAINSSRLGLETMLFTVRSRQLAGILAAEFADHYLAGLCIGSDIRSALNFHTNVRTVTLIGAPPLTELYAAALASLGFVSRQVDGKTAALAGLTHAYRTLFP